MSREPMDSKLTVSRRVPVRLQQLTLMRRILFHLFVAMPVLIFATSVVAAPRPKNVILVIGDGMGPSHVTAARWIRGDRLQLLRMLEVANEWGKATGAITTTDFWDATPAAFLSHAKDRHNDARAIVQQIVSGKASDRAEPLLSLRKTAARRRVTHRARSMQRMMHVRRAIVRDLLAPLPALRSAPC